MPFLLLVVPFFLVSIYLVTRGLKKQEGLNLFWKRGPQRAPKEAKRRLRPPPLSTGRIESVPSFIEPPQMLLERLTSFVEGRNLVFIQGPAGSGKTTLLSGLARGDGVKGFSVFWFTGREEVGCDVFFGKLSSFLKSKGEYYFDAILKQGHLNVGEKLRFLSERVDRAEVVIFIDDFDVIQDIRMRQVLDIGKDLKRSKMVIAVSDDPSTQVFSCEGAGIFEICNYNREVCEEILKERTHKERIRICEAFSYNPYIVQVFQRSFPAVRNGEALAALQMNGKDILKDAIERLGDDERGILFFIGCANEPVPLDCVRYFYKGEKLRNKLDSLKRQRFIQYDKKQNTYFVPFVIKELLEPDDSLFKKYHLLCSKYYHDSLEGFSLENPEVFLHLSRHLILSGHIERAITVLSANRKWLIESGYGDGLSRLIDKIERARVSHDSWIWVLEVTGDLLLSTGECDEAILEYMEMLSDSKKYSNERGVVSAYNNLGLAYKKKGDLLKAIEYFELSLGIVEDTNWKIPSFEHIWPVYKGKGKWEEMVYYYRPRYLRDTTIGKQVEDIRLRAETYNNLGLAYLEKGIFNRSLECLEEGLAASRHIKDTEGMAEAFTNLGRLYRSQRNFTQAVESFQRAIKCARSQGDPGREANLLLEISETQRCTGDLHRSIQSVLQCLELLSQNGDKRKEAACLELLGELYGAMNEALKAESSFNKSLEIRRAIGDIFGEVEIYKKLGIFYRGREDFNHAILCFQRCLAVASHHPDLKKCECKIWLELGITYTSRGDYEKALSCLKNASCEQERWLDLKDRLLLNVTFGTVYFERKDLKNAFSSYGVAFRMASETKDRKDMLLLFERLSLLERAILASGDEDLKGRCNGLKKEIEEILA